MTAAVAQEPFSGDYEAAVAAVLTAVGAEELLVGVPRVLIKPNLVNRSAPPVTLPVECAEAVIRWVRSHSDGEILVAEGPGEPGFSAQEAFRHHGYERLAERYGATLVDLDEAELVRLEDTRCSVFPEMWLPRVVLESFVISLPVLKAHSLAGVTLSMKNMMGCAPAAHYRSGAWNKAAFHGRMHRSVFELNMYRRPDLALVDGSMGLSEYHLGGPLCDPPVRRILAGCDPVAVDAAGAALLGLDWRDIAHIRLADGVLGRADPAPNDAYAPESTRCR